MSIKNRLVYISYLPGRIHFSLIYWCNQQLVASRFKRLNINTLRFVVIVRFLLFLLHPAARARLLLKLYRGIQHSYFIAR